MRLCEILSIDRIMIDEDGADVQDKASALSVLARLLSPALGIKQAEVESLLLERERLQSTGIGDGVAIPHTAIEEAEKQAAALLLCPKGIAFEAIDGRPVNIVFGVVGPKRATGEHLRTLARISRLLRDPATREKLLYSESPAAAFELIQNHEARAEGKT